MNCVLLVQNYSLKMLKYHLLIIGVFYVLKSWFYDINPVNTDTDRGTQREYSSEPLKHSIIKCILVFKR